MSDWTQVEINEAIEAVGKKASSDKDFRKLCTEDPNKAIKEAYGKDVPEGFKVKLIENESGIDETFVLPDFMGEELSDDELDKVAGGKGCRNQCDSQASCSQFCANKQR